MVCALMLTVAGTVEEVVEAPEVRSIFDWAVSEE